MYTVKRAAVAVAVGVACGDGGCGCPKPWPMKRGQGFSQRSVGVVELLLTRIPCNLSVGVYVACIYWCGCLVAEKPLEYHNLNSRNYDHKMCNFFDCIQEVRSNTSETTIREVT